LKRFDVDLSNFYGWIFDAQIGLGLLKDLVNGVAPLVTFVFRVKVNGGLSTFSSVDQLEIHTYRPLCSNSLFTVFLE
jgi:hypothetical protein